MSKSLKVFLIGCIMCVVSAMLFSGMTGNALSLNGGSNIRIDDINGVIYNVPAGTLPSVLVSHFSEASELIGVASGRSGFVGTGCTVKLFDDKAYEAIVSGDVDGDGAILSGDYIIMKRAGLGKYTFSACGEKAVDFDESGKFDEGDLNAVKKYLVGGSVSEKLDLISKTEPDVDIDGSTAELIKDGICKYALVYDDNGVMNEKEAAEKLATKINELFGEGTVKAVSDKVYNNALVAKYDYEILIGDTNRAESVASRESGKGMNYSVSVAGKRVVIYGTDSDMLMRGVDYFIGKYFKKKKDITLSASDKVYVDGDKFKPDAWKLEGIPYYATSKDGRYSADVFLVGQGYDPEQKLENESTMQIIGKTTRNEFEAYCATLIRCGYKLEYTNEISYNYYRAYYNGEKRIYVYYTYYVTRVIYDISSQCSIQDFGYTYEKKEGDTTVIYQYALAGGAANLFIVKLADNSVMIFDGGTTDQFTDKVCMEFMAFMREITGIKEGEIRIAAWSISHTHGDHFPGVRKFLEKYNANFTLERMFFNVATFNDYNARYCDPEADHSDNDWTLDMFQSMGKAVMKYYPDCIYKKIHVGEVINIADVKVTVLFTIESTYDYATMRAGMSAINDTSTILRLDFDGKSMLMPADYFSVLSIPLGCFERSVFDCDIFQVGHHGYNVDHETYQLLRSPVVFYPCIRSYTTGNQDIIDVYDKVKKYAEQIYFMDKTYGVQVIDGEIKCVYENKFLEQKP